MNLQEWWTKRDGRLDHCLFDAETGHLIPDRTRDYKVLNEARRDGYTWLAVQGPSGDIDVFDVDAETLHRCVLDDANELATWIHENYSGLLS